MLAQEYFRFYSEFSQRGIILSFTGYLSEGVLFSLGEALKQKMALEATDANLTKRVFSVFVEQVQNIIRYSADRLEGEVDRPVELSSGMITVGSEHGRFFVVCANTVWRDDVPRLRARLEKLESLDKEALRALYKEKLREPPDDDSKGATLGLIEIARRASAPLQYDFVAIEPDDMSFFCLKAFI